MERIFFRVTETQTEEKIIEELEDRGYNRDNMYIFDGREFIKGDDAGNCFYTSNTEEELLEYGYEEQFITPQFEIGEQIAVSNVSKEKALEDIKTDNYKYYYTGCKLSNGRDIVEFVGNIGNIGCSYYEYIAKIPKNEVVIIKTADGQEMEIDKEKAIELGFTFNK